MSVKLTFPEVIFCLHIILSCISHLRVLSASGRTLSGLVTDMPVTRWSEAKATKIWIILQVCECITRRTPHRKVSSHLKVLLTTASTTGFQSTECLLVPHCRGTGTQLELKCKDWRTVCIFTVFERLYPFFTLMIYQLQQGSPTPGLGTSVCP